MHNINNPPARPGGIGISAIAASLHDSNSALHVATLSDASASAPLSAPTSNCSFDHMPSELIGGDNAPDNTPSVATSKPTGVSELAASALDEKHHHEDDVYAREFGLLL